jgi:hypothetical protein
VTFQVALHDAPAGMTGSFMKMWIVLAVTDELVNVPPGKVFPATNEIPAKFWFRSVNSKPSSPRLKEPLVSGLTSVKVNDVAASVVRHTL